MFFYSNASEAEDIIIYIRDDVYEDYQAFVDGKDIATINDFQGKTVRRDVIDMILAQKALKLGGFNHSFKYIPGKLNFRNTKMLQQGKLLISFDSYWLSDANALESDIYISDAVIKKGEYVAGLYTSPKNKAALNIKKLEDLSRFTAVSTPKWRTDWQTLSQLPLKQLVAEDEWLSMARMVNLMWIDIIFMPFNSTKDKTFSMDKITLIPVENVAIKFDDSRHFVLSKKHPLGAQAFQAINIGLKKLREQKLITKAYTQAGFFVDRNKINILNN
ncbi:hypothetical protein GCM10011501_02460 [Thalassotalea profundi]|uniref:Solute-binding protein family 3/N-terminal domain-containing protein n=2 Tax=Thalassotalea profundi TaxID=2036687 RepID=A0ABQ3ICH1_9GAMM|nr:hypothetical protein GCM10011501_02460 [Thalassotalea profundi]